MPPRAPVPIELPRPARDEAVASLQRYATEHLDEPLGNLATTALLDFVLEEIGPSIYNQAVADVLARLQDRLGELDAEVHQPEFTYWARHAPKGGRR